MFMATIRDRMLLNAIVVPLKASYKHFPFVLVA